MISKKFWKAYLNFPSHLSSTPPLFTHLITPGTQMPTMELNILKPWHWGVKSQTIKHISFMGRRVLGGKNTDLALACGSNPTKLLYISHLIFTFLICRSKALLLSPSCFKEMYGTETNLKCPLYRRYFVSTFKYFNFTGEISSYRDKLTVAWRDTGHQGRPIYYTQYTIYTVVYTAYYI